jgi:Predicted membrane protein (DUF2306)
MTPAAPSREDAQRPLPRPVDDRLLRWIGRLFRIATWVGLGIFGSYIVLRATGATFKNFEQWQPLLAGRPMATASAWIANVGIGMHFLMGAVLVLAWPILLSARIRAHHRAVHRWTGRVYVAASFLAGTGGLSFILTHGTYSRAAAIAFSLWGAVMMLCAVKAYVHARAKRFDLHRAWAIRLFATVLGSWLFDIETQAWKDLAGGVGMAADGASGPIDYALLYLFFVPNLLIAEFFVRNMHRRLVLPGRLRWPAVTVLAGVALVFVYAIGVASATRTGKFGEHLLRLLGNKNLTTLSPPRSATAPLGCTDATA